MASSTASVNTTSTTLEPLHIFSEEDGHAHNVSSLPPTDRGRDAWLFLAASFMIEALVWGFALSFGVMQEYYSTHAPFAGSSNIATIGTTATGLMYFDAPILCALVALRPGLRRWMIWSGPVVIAGALIGSSFATTVDQLIVTQGVLYAIGGTVIYIPTISLLDEWFVARKGLAFGIMWAGTGTAGVVMPLAMNAALERYGHEIVLRGVACITLIALLPLLPFIKPRLPPSRAHRIDLGFLVSPQFLVLQLANIIQAMGFFLPGIYLPTYASEQLGAGPTVSALTLVVVNAATVAGSIITGGMTDKIHATTVVAIIAVTSSAAVFVFWGLSTNLGLLFAFCAVYGITAGGFSSVWTGMLRIVQRSGDGVGRNLNMILALGFLGAGRGIGNVISGPVSQKLISGASSHHGPGYGGEFGPLIIFTGVTAICSGFAILLRAKPGFL